MDPFERAKYEGMGYDRWFIAHIWAIAPAASGYRDSVNSRPARSRADSTWIGWRKR